MAYMNLEATGVEELMKKFNTITTGGRVRAATRASVRVAAKPILQQAKKNMAMVGNKYWTGQLKRSLGIHVKSYGSAVSTAAVGARAGFRAEGLKERGTGRTVIRWPTKYMHLVEKGFNHFRKGRIEGKPIISSAGLMAKDEAVHAFADDITMRLIKKVFG